jgi:multiple sugar transport system substrate-binding protein
MAVDGIQDKGFTRAEALRRAMAAAGVLGLGGPFLQACGGGDDDGPAANKNIAAPKVVNGKLDFGGVEIRGLGDEFLGPIWEWYSDDLEKEANVKIAEPAQFAFGTESQAVTPKLIGKTDAPWNVISYAAWFLGDFVATGNLEPLDPYLKGFEGYGEYTAGVTPVFRELYTKSKGQTYALMADGDTHGFHYRPSYFENPTLQRAYRKQFNRELGPPRTWDEYVEMAAFFTQQLKGDGVYGTQWATEPAVSWSWWLDTAGSLGMRYFDESMKPTVNSEAGVKGLDILLRLSESSPPGVENFSNNDTISNWNAGKVVTQAWWQDLTEFSPKDSADAGMPGSVGPDGNLKVSSAMAFSRLFSVPANQPDETKQAAVWAAYRLSHPDYSVYSVADPYNGLEPYHDGHFTPDAVAQFTKPNPKRGTAKDYPENKGIYTSVARAQNHADAIRTSTKTGFPQPNWPGAGEYMRVLGTEIQAAASGQKSSKEALDSVAEQWSENVEKRGKEEQQEYYTSFLASAKRLGM